MIDVSVRFSNVLNLSKCLIVEDVKLHLACFDVLNDCSICVSFDRFEKLSRRWAPMDAHVELKTFPNSVFHSSSSSYFQFGLENVFKQRERRLYETFRPKATRGGDIDAWQRLLLLSLLPLSAGHSLVDIQR